MSFVIPVNVLKNAIKLLRKITPRSSNLPILRCLLFHPRKGCVSATDLEQSLTIKLEGEGKAEPFIIDLKELADVIKPVRNGDVVFTPDTDGRVEIKLPNGEALNVSTMALCEWPEPMECKGKSTKIEVDSGFFDLFRKAASLVSKDVTRFAMQHVCMDESNLAGGDGHRLAHFAHGLDVPMKLVVPPTKLLKSKDVFGNATLTLYGKNPKVCKIATEEFTYIIKLCESAYPNYEQVMPQPDPEDRVVALDASQLDEIRTSLKEFAPVDKGMSPVGLLAGACGFHLIDDGKTPKTITPQAEVTGPKENLLCSINRDYLEEALACGFDHIAFHGPSTAMRLFFDKGKMVIMPLRNGRRTVEDALKLIGAPPVKKESKQTEQPKEMIPMPKENDTQVAKPNLTVVDKPKTVDPMEELLAFSTELAEQARDLSNKVRELPKKIRAAKADLKNKDKAFNEARKAMESFQKAAGF